MLEDKKIMQVLFPSFPNNPSSQDLVREEASNKARSSGSRKWRYVSILFFVNLINYMDRFTVAGILESIKDDYGIGDAKAGALQTAFVVTYMFFAPLFGYLGDRHSRRIIMAVGVFIWAIFTLIGSFMPGYYSFLICRGMVGIGEASYSTIAPTIISDMFVKEERSKMLAVFFFAIPVGCGSGYILGSEMSNLAGDWRWGLRVTPILGFIAVLMILFLLKDPNRGESEGHGNEIEATTYLQDLKDLGSNKSFFLSTLGFTCVAFCTGALSWWGPLYIISGLKSFGPPETHPMKIKNVALVFGAVTMLSGIVGVPLGSVLSTRLQRRYPRADPIICGTGLVISAFFLGLGMLLVRSNIILTFVFLFAGEVALNLNWSIVADILLYVVIPTRRSTAEAIQILVSHALGDAGSPYFIGLISDSLKVHYNNTQAYCTPPASSSNDNSTLIVGGPCEETIEYFSLQNSLLSNCGVQLIGGILFFVCAIYLVKDRRSCQRIIDGESDSSWTSEDKETNQQTKPFIPISSLTGSEL
eukprot:TRINITY_DN2690_c0_g1_i3.p1 TRINITY_DN2690_c0_g1~~TRINITY_DN2690_c0_g1_i3.p1  ORF type:complete len:529 (+),score=129.13 TRINITY_DN2690_c0_g1_i3:76-1662(+)